MGKNIETKETNERFQSKNSESNIEELANNYTGTSGNVGVETLVKALSESVNSLQRELNNKVYQLQTLNFELKKRNDFISSITSVLPEIIFVHDYKKGCITYSNRCYGKNEHQFDEYSCLQESGRLEGACENCNFRSMMSYYNNLIMQNGYEEGENEIEIGGQKKWFKTVIKNFETDEDGEVISKLHIVTDITSVKREHIALTQKEKELSNSLTEKELLLQEVHHRVKNNLQLIISMIDMKVSRIDDGEAKFQLKEITNRIHSISLIHEELYQNGIGSCVDVSQYVKKLGLYLSEFYSGQKNNISLKLDVEPDIRIMLAKAIPFGLLVNELICNSYKHAYGDGGTGEILIRLYQEGDELFTLIKDDGRGLPDIDVVRKKGKSLGMKLVNGLVAQLQGKIEFKCDGGCSALIELPNKINKLK